MLLPFDRVKLISDYRAFRMKSLFQLLLLQLLLACITLTSHASVIFTESFNSYTNYAGSSS